MLRTNVKIVSRYVLIAIECLKSNLGYHLNSKNLKTIHDKVKQKLFHNILTVHTEAAAHQSSSL